MRTSLTRVRQRGAIFDSDRLEPGQAFEFSFDTSGVFAYFCNLHPRMTGQVEVTP